MTYPFCGVTKTLLMRLKLIQDGGEFDDLGENVSRIKTDI